MEEEKDGEQHMHKHVSINHERFAGETYLTSWFSMLHPFKIKGTTFFLCHVELWFLSLVLCSLRSVMRLEWCRSYPVLFLIKNVLWSVQYK